MTRAEASKLTRDTLNAHKLQAWGVRIMTDNKYASVLGLCDYKTKTIILNGHHIDIHPSEDVIDTIKHEVAHALCPFHQHDNVWRDKALELGCKDPKPCSHLTLPENVIDAIRSGNLVEVEIEETVIKTPKYKISKLEEKCPYCGKVAVEKIRKEAFDREGNKQIWITLECFHFIVKTIPKGTAFETMVSNDWKDEIKNCKHKWNKNQCTKCGEFRLFNFQIEGAKFIEIGLSTQKGVGVFDEMGLGKTVQALSYVRFHPELSTPTIYVVKSAIKFNWFKEIVRWLSPAFGAQVINTSKDPVLPGLKSYIISYDLLKRYPIEKLAKVNPKLVILDECQQIKNPDSTRTQGVRKLLQPLGVKVIPLSGTPWKNRGSEFFPVLNAIAPTMFPGHKKFQTDWVDYYWDGKYMKEGGISNVAKFKDYVKDIIIRREYNEVMDEFPEVNRTRLPIQLDAFMQEQYDESEGDFLNWFNSKILGGEDLNGLEVLAKMSKMRHIVGLAKIPATVAHVEQFIEETDQKIIVFVHHKDVGSSLVSEFENRYVNTKHKDYIEDIAVMKITGEMSDVEKYNVAEAFQKTPRAILIASTLAAGEGVNLQTCSYAVFHERQWNPQNEDQAAPGRMKRIGQLAKVINIPFPTAENTIDDIFDGIVHRKRVAFHNTMNNSEMEKWSEADIGMEMAEAILAKHKKSHKKRAS